MEDGDEDDEDEDEEEDDEEPEEGGEVGVDCVCQFQVIVESWVIANVVEVLLPLEGTEPVPVHPVHT